MIPNVKITVKDGGLAQLPASSANTQVKVGVCSDGVVGTIYVISNPGTLTTTLGQGPLVEAAAVAMAAAGGPILCLPINPSAAGGIVSPGVVHTGTGAGTVTVSFAPRQTVQLKITTGGVGGVFQFAISLGGGVYGTPVPSTAGTFTYVVPGTLTTLTITDHTYTLNDVWTVSTLGAVTVVGAGTAGWITQASSPLDAYNVQVSVDLAGAPGTGQFEVSMDGGNNKSGAILIPSGGAFQPPNTGVVLTFASAFVVGDLYTFTTTTAGFNGTDVTNACAVALGSPVAWGFLHLVGAAANAAGAATIAGVLATQMNLAFLAYLFVFAIHETPIVEVDTTIVTAFQNFVSIRVSSCCGDLAVQSPLSGRIFRRNNAWEYAGRLAAIIPSEDAGFFDRGPLPSTRGIYPNFGSTGFDPTVLDGGRFTTPRQFPGEPGYFLTHGLLMCSPGSDFNLVQRIRVMNLACQITRRAELPYLNGSFRVDPDTGFIDERDASAFERKVNAKLSNGLVPANASAATATVDRGANILSTSTLPVTVSVVPLFTAEVIDTQIGFSNPAAG
jgi:hypothetical protein